jgi:hypothetical protein
MPDDYASFAGFGWDLCRALKLPVYTGLAVILSLSQVAAEGIKLVTLFEVDDISFQYYRFYIR